MRVRGTASQRAWGRARVSARGGKEEGVSDEPGGCPSSVTAPNRTLPARSPTRGAPGLLAVASPVL